MDEKLTKDIQQWLDTPAEERDLEQGALYLLKLSRNAIMHRNISANLKRHAADIEYQLRKYLGYRLQSVTHAEVLEMQAQVNAIVEKNHLDMPTKTKADKKKANDEFKKGKRTDHDALPHQDDDTTSFVINYGNGEKQAVTIPTIGIHNVYNALAAFATGLELGVTPEEAVRGLTKYEPSGMRQRVKIVNSIRFIEDCYNASPDSQQAALRMLSSLQAKRKIAVLGDMLELGAISEEAHRNAGLLAAKNKIDVLMTYGERSQATAEKATECGVPVVKSFLDTQELADALVQMLQEGDAILFKASRGMALEDVINSIYSRIK